MIWLDQHKDCLRQLALDGLTADAIACEMNRRFGTHLDKNAIIGAAHRNSVSFKRAAGFQPSARTARWAKVAAPPVAPEPVADARVALQPQPVAFVNCMLVHLTNKTCRWPLNEGDPFLFCGSPTADLADGVPYCRKHSRLAYS